MLVTDQNQPKKSLHVRSALGMRWGLSADYDIESLGDLGSVCYMFRECHVPCMLKTSFVDFEKEFLNLYLFNEDNLLLEATSRAS